MANLKRSVEVSTTGTLTAADMRVFLNEIPGAAEISIKVLTGDRRDPRESGYRETIIQASWTETTE